MTAKDLTRLDELYTETKGLRSRLRELKSASVVSATNYSRSGAGGGTGDCVSRTVENIVSTEQEIAQNQIEMGDIINTIQSEDLRELFRRKYIHRQTWQRIADEMSRYSGDSKAPERRLKRVRKRMGVKMIRF